MLKQCLLLSALGFIGFVACSAVGQNPVGNRKCVPCDCLPRAARVPCAQASPDWYGNGHDPAKQTKILTKELKLTADQESQVLYDLKSAKSQLEAVRSDNSLSKRDRKCKIASNVQASDDQIRAFLDTK
jgi:hypothetical protein